ncbi:hypothetical protein OEE31_002584 [Salmonella enterica]|nr:hypothetical protein [Salmonella enterica subsp. enterica serovar Afula]EJX6614301.1 hypothetical protein [Salmonella enterica]
MVRRSHLNYKNRFLLALLLTAGICLTPAHADRKASETWQELKTSTGTINGTPPIADGVLASIYQGSIWLDPAQAHDVSFAVFPRDFSVDAANMAMQAVNEFDTEGDIFGDAPVAWESETPPAMNLVWADAATPDEPLSPQPVANQSFCAQNMAGRHLVVWPEIATGETSTALSLKTETGAPNSSVTSLLNQKIAINIAPSVGDPILLSADHVDEALKASKVKAGETITLRVRIDGCDGKPQANLPFIITRSDAVNRQGVVNNTAPLSVGGTELTTTTTEYHGTTDKDGSATIAITQADGPGVKTTLKVSPEGAPTLFASVDVIFTTLYSPDSSDANMYGHMPETDTGELNGVTYTFTRPKLAKEAPSNNGTVDAHNETWAQFNWNGADNHCDILPAAEQLVALRDSNADISSYSGWPLSNGGEYWSSSGDQLDTYHYAVHLNSGDVERESNSSVFLTSCVDKALPEAHPQITITPGSDIYTAQVGEKIELVVNVVDRDTQQPLPYRYVEVFVDPASNRKGVHEDVWDNQRVLIHTENMYASSPEHYVGSTDASGQMHLELSHDNGLGVKTPIRIVMKDGESGQVEYAFSTIFTVNTSPNVEGANMYGHMQGVVDAGNLYKRPLLAVEASHKTGQQSENNEVWATFNSAEAATRQCGAGQVPDRSLLDHLYSENPSNAMETEHGWPTQEKSYITADIEDAQTVHVDLGNGKEGKSANAENYLTCSANEMVSTLDVYFNDDPALRNAVAEVGQQIKMTVHSKNMLNGATIPYTDFTVTLENSRRRDGLTTGFTDPSQGELLFNGEAHHPGDAGSRIYKGITDANGNAEIIVEQPQGVGVLTSLNIIPVDSIIKTSIARSVKFTVVTSPDTAAARMWGHMPETISVDGFTFERPKLAEEAPGAPRTLEENNEVWARVDHASANGNPDAGGCAANRLPRIDQLQALYNANSAGAIHSIQGWPVNRPYWSSAPASRTSWKQTNLDTGTVDLGGDVTDYVSCLASDNPPATSITIEPVDASLWYDNGGVHAVKVKEGDTLQLKVTVKDASGNSLPDAPFVLNRGDGFDRQGTKYSASSGSSIVTPVIVDGQSLNDPTTQIGLITGEDGSKIINVTRPDTHGTLTAITATLYNNASVSGSIDTIFTVITSPDSSKAKMWGHMPETVTAKSGAVFKRPFLASEVQVPATDVVENNETWASLINSNAKTACGGEAYLPRIEDLQSLYDAWPDGAMGVNQGWPLLNKSYQSSTYTYAGSGNYNMLSFALNDGGRKSTTLGTNLYLTCLREPHPMVSSLTMTSPLYNETDGFARAKVGETIPVTITALDGQGNPVEGVVVSLSRSAAGGRSITPPESSQADLSINNDDIVLTSDDTMKHQMTTGADGAITLSVAQDEGIGYLTSLKAKTDIVGVSAPDLPLVFTVVSSPDTPKANYWGHMPETFTARNGASFKRPLLYRELSSTMDTSLYSEANEDWYLVKNIDEDRGACPLTQIATAADAQALYDDHPDGAIATDLGLPLGKNWWLGDRKLNGQYIYWQYINFKTGKTDTTTSMSNSALQLCLTQPRQAKIALSLLPWNENKAAAVVKKGEQIAATVTVTNGAGQAINNALVKISRDNSLRRDGTEYSNASSEDDITLSAIQPSSIATFAMNTPDNFLLLQTNAQGQATFTVSQDATAGLKTALRATLMDDESQTDSKDAIFTVLTSPDSDKATMWGHMPESVTSSEGVVFKRPQLYAEAPKPYVASASSYTVAGEAWVQFDHGNNGGIEAQSGCDYSYQPTQSELQTLYNDYPGGELQAQYGWPLSGQSSYWGFDGDKSKWPNVDMKTGAAVAATTNKYLMKSLSCTTKHHVLPAMITLTSTQETDVAKGGIVAKRGEAIPLTVTITGEDGQPMAAGFTLTRGDSYNRQGEARQPSGTDDNIALQQLTPQAATFDFVETSDLFSGMTGPDGKATFMLRQDNSPGAKTTITATATLKSTLTSSQNVIFTVLTSPDTAKANYWGHMPETVMTNSGLTFSRPRLYAEVGTGSNYLLNNEVWPMVTPKEMTAEQICDAAHQPSWGELDALYNDYPSGKLAVTFGWPTEGANNYWWASDPDSVTHYYQAINLEDGSKKTSSSATRFAYREVCLANAP